MNRKLKLATQLFLFMMLFMPIALAKTAPTDVIQTIPPIVTSSPQAVAECTVLEAIPGSVVSGQTGFTLATCPQTLSAIRFRHATSETPTFILATGWSQIFLMQQGYACSFSFHDPITNALTGVNMTNGGPILFTDTYGSTTALYSGGGMGYNYCLYYSNPPSNGILSFTIAWTP